MKDDELWLKKIKERLDDYSEPLPDAGWERLEKALPTSAPMSVVGTKKKILFRRWAMTAAAVALVAVSSVSLWLLQSPVVDDVRRAAEPALAAIPDALPAPAEPDVQGEEPEFVIRRVIEQESSRQALVAQHLETEKNISEMKCSQKRRMETMSFHQTLLQLLKERSARYTVLPAETNCICRPKRNLLRKIKVGRLVCLLEIQEHLP